MDGDDISGSRDRCQVDQMDRKLAVSPQIDTVLVGLTLGVPLCVVPLQRLIDKNHWI